MDPLRYPIVERDVHEAPVKNFPYCIYYRIRKNLLIVIAVYHQARDPLGWQQRLE